eukprot:Sdes_comp20188_c0_seq1m13465
MHFSRHQIICPTCRQCVFPLFHIIKANVAACRFGSDHCWLRKCVCFCFEKKSTQAQKELSKATCIAQESVSQIRTIRAFASEDIELEKFSSQLARSETLNQELGVGIGIFQGLSNFAINCITLVVLYYGGVLVLQHEITIGDLMSFILSTSMIQKALSTFSEFFGHTARG